MAAINLLAILGAALGLVDFFVPKSKLEKWHEIIRSRLDALQRGISYSWLRNRVLQFFGEFWDKLGGIALLVMIGVGIGFYREITGRVDDFHWRSGMIFLLVFFGIMFVAPLVAVVVIIVLKLVMRYLIWSPKGVTALITLPLATWTLYTKLIAN